MMVHLQKLYIKVERLCNNFIGIGRLLLSNISCQNVNYFTIVLVPGLLGFCLGVQSYNDRNFPFNIVTLYLLPTFDMN